MAMLRIFLENHGETSIVRIEGKFAGPESFNYVSKLIQGLPPNRVVVDLSEVIYVDAEGEEALFWLSQIGVFFKATSYYTIEICRRLCLKMA
ncbi:MAG: hypothetical protein P4L03_06480 [Terracidiphilus sp.]|nr:hypothetical protein [Terracidiphilus sp.]